MQKFTAINTESLSAEVEHQLTDLIRNGVFKPNDKLPSENGLAERFEVSRSTIREALMNLKSAGLIEIKRGIYAGAYVAEPTAIPITKALKNLVGLQKISFAQLIEVRLHFEPALAGYAAILRTEADLQKITHLLNSIHGKQATTWDDARKVNINFHLELARIVNNPVMLFLMESITSIYYNFLIDATKSHAREKHVSKLKDEHVNILDAVREQDAGRAHQLMNRHILGTYYVYSNILTDLKDPEMEQRFDAIS